MPFYRISYSSKAYAEGEVVDVTRVGIFTNGGGSVEVFAAEDDVNNLGDEFTVETLGEAEHKAYVKRANEGLPIDGLPLEEDAANDPGSRNVDTAPQTMGGGEDSVATP